MPRKVPILPSGLADTGNVLRFMPGPAGEQNQIHAQALINQKPHLTEIVASLRRVLRTGG